jgi:hypothetical protein
MRGATKRLDHGLIVAGSRETGRAEAAWTHDHRAVNARWLFLSGIAHAARLKPAPFLGGSPNSVSAYFPPLVAWTSGSGTTCSATNQTCDSFVRIISLTRKISSRRSPRAVTWWAAPANSIRGAFDYGWTAFRNRSESEPSPAPSRHSGARHRDCFVAIHGRLALSCSRPTRRRGNP